MAAGGRGAWAAAGVAAVGLAAWLLLRGGAGPAPVTPPPAGPAPPSSPPSVPAPDPGAAPPAGGEPGAAAPAGAPAETSPPPAEGGLGVRVVDGEGGPVAGAVVYLLPAPLVGTDDLEGAGAVQAGTGEDGACNLPLPAPAGTLGVAAEGFLPATRPFEGASRGAVPEPLVVVLDRGGVVAGTVVAAREGTPVAEAEVNVFLDPGEGGVAWEFPGAGGRARGLQWCLTGEDGTFSLRGLPAGRLRIEVELPGYLQEKLVPWEGDVDAPAEGLLVSLQPMPILQVAVTPWEGTGAIQVSLTDRGTGEVVAGRGEGEGTGRVRLGIPRAGGAFELSVEAPGRGWARASVDVEPGTESVERTLDLRPWPGLRVPAPEGKPFAGTLVIRDPSGAVVRVLEAEGEAVEPEVPPGRYDLLYFDGERISAPFTLDLGEGPGQTARLELLRGVAFRVGSGEGRGCRVEGPDGSHLLVVARGEDRWWGETADLRAGDAVLVRPGDGLSLRTDDPAFPPVPLVEGKVVVVDFARR